MKTFDLPRENVAFLACETWDFSLTLNGRDFQVSMDGIVGVREEDELSAFQRIVVRVIDKKNEASSAVADRLLDIYNATWNKAAPISREEFIEKLAVSSISICGDGSAELDFEDGDMFLGHSVVVRFDRDGAITNATIEG
jgi:hypothetical protein